MELPTINRCAVVLKPTEAYFEWARKSPEDDPNSTETELHWENSVYLIPDMESGFEAWLKRNFTVMFEQELDSWCTDESLWPKDRSFKTFKKFFKVSFHSMVFDMCNDRIMRDD